MATEASSGKDRLNILIEINVLPACQMPLGAVAGGGEDEERGGKRGAQSTAEVCAQPSD
jgi:hypothetical protein